METRRIAGACFSGGALCSAVAVILGPSFWWLGLLSGLALGYLAYDFGEVWKAVVIAAARAWEEVSKGLGIFLSRPYYHIQLFAWTGVFLIARWFFLAIQAVQPSTKSQEQLSLLDVAITIVAIVFLFLIILSPRLLLWVLHSIWRKGEDLDRWEHNRFCREYVKGEGRYFQNMGFAEAPETYPNIIRWLWIGLLWLIPEAGKVCVKCAIGIVLLTWLVTRFLALFFLHLFRLIHSQKRVLCAIDGTLGGIISYFLLAETADTATAKVVLVIAGGILGAFLGVVNWELVSKRWLRVGAVTS